MNRIGSKVWFKGDEVTITSEPFTMYGGEFQKAVTESGKEIVVATKAQAAKNAKASQEARKAQQAEFRKLSVDCGCGLGKSCFQHVGRKGW